MNLSRRQPIPGLDKATPKPREFSIVLPIALSFISVGGSLGGVWFGAKLTADNSLRMTRIEFAGKILDKRTEILKQIYEGRERAQQLRLIMPRVEKLSRACTVDPTICNTSMEKLSDGLDLEKMARNQASMFSALNLAAIYFCNSTRAAVGKMRDGATNWWMDNEGIDNVIGAMNTEFQCGMPKFQ